MFAFYIPFLPAIIWYGALLAYAIILVEALVAAPLRKFIGAAAVVKSAGDRAMVGGKKPAPDIPAGGIPTRPPEGRGPDRMARARITAGINRLAAGAFGDCKPVGSGVWELRVSHGPGYRVYYAQAGKNLILLLLGGDKRQQAADIKKAIQCWEDYQRRKP